MPITINRKKLFPASCFALIFTSLTFAFGSAADFYVDSNSFLKIAIIHAILLVIFTVIYFSEKIFIPAMRRLNLL